MDLKTEFGLDHLLASCPNCQKTTLYCGKIDSKLNDLKRKEVLFCKTCKFVVSVGEFKKMLFTK